MSLFTTHIGYAIKDFLENRDIEGEQATRGNPYADEKYRIEHVDVSDASNPMVHTSGGVFKLIIVRVDAPARSIQPQMQRLEEIPPKQLPWKED